MGTMIQQLKLDEADFRGERFAGLVARPARQQRSADPDRADAIRDIHLAYFMAGADICATNTFSSTTIAQADYGLESVARELNRRRRASGARGRGARRTKRRAPRFVAGAMGPTNRTASISPDVSNPGFRATSFDDLREAYKEAALGLIEGGADLCWSRRSSTRSTPRPRSTRSRRLSPRRASACRS